MKKKSSKKDKREIKLDEIKKEYPIGTRVRCAYDEDNIITVRSHEFIKIYGEDEDEDGNIDVTIRNNDDDDTNIFLYSNGEKAETLEEDPIVRKIINEFPIGTIVRLEDGTEIEIDGRAHDSISIDDPDEDDLDVSVKDDDDNWVWLYDNGKRIEIVSTPGPGSFDPFN